MPIKIVYSLHSPSKSPSHNVYVISQKRRIRRSFNDAPDDNHSPRWHKKHMLSVPYRSMRQPAVIPHWYLSSGRLGTRGGQLVTRDPYASLSLTQMREVIVMKSNSWVKTLLPSVGLAICLLFSASASAPCDSFDGPIIPEALEALENIEVQQQLKWVEPEHEEELIVAFERA